MFFTNTARFRLFRRRKDTRSTLSQTTRNELKRLVHSSDPVVRKVWLFLHLRVLSRVECFSSCITSLRRLMQRCRDSASSTPAILPIRTTEKICACPLFSLVDTSIHAVASDWDKIQTPNTDQIISYDQLPKAADPRALSKLAILKFNGGLGTSMGTYYHLPYLFSVVTQNGNRYVRREERTRTQGRNDVPRPHRKAGRTPQ